MMENCIDLSELSKEIENTGAGISDNSNYLSQQIKFSYNLLSEKTDSEEVTWSLDVRTHSQEDLSTAGLINISLKELFETSTFKQEKVMNSKPDTMEDDQPSTSSYSKSNKKRYIGAGRGKNRSLKALFCDLEGMSPSNNFELHNKRKYNTDGFVSRKHCSRTESLKSLLLSKERDGMFSQSYDDDDLDVEGVRKNKCVVDSLTDMREEESTNLFVHYSDEHLISDVDSPDHLFKTPIKSDSNWNVESKIENLDETPNTLHHGNCSLKSCTSMNSEYYQERFCSSCNRCELKDIPSTFGTLPELKALCNTKSSECLDPKYQGPNAKPNILDTQTGYKTYSSRYLKNFKNKFSRDDCSGTKTGFNCNEFKYKKSYEPCQSCRRRTALRKGSKEFVILGHENKSGICPDKKRGYNRWEILRDLPLSFKEEEDTTEVFEYSCKDKEIEKYLKFLNESKFETGFIDTHCHIDFLFKKENYLNTFSSYIDLCQEFDPFPKSYEGCITVFCDPSTFFKLSWWTDILAEKNVWGTFGCHPHFANRFSSTDEEFLYYALQLEKVVAAGEFGLDYSGRNSNNSSLQKYVFIKQLNIAMKLKKPVVIHCRDAFEDCYEIMRKILPKNYKIHKHCFTGDVEEAKLWMEHFPNLYLGFTCLITQTGTRAAIVKNAAKEVPLNRVLLETDSPYFRPHYLSNSSYSHPGMAIHVASAISKLRQISIEDVLEAARKNTREVYSV